jgi:PmbA protein
MTNANGEIDAQLELLNDTIQAAKRAGADAADALMYQSMSLEVSYRLGEREDLERSESKSLGLRVFVGQQQAAISSNDFSADTLNDAVERAVAMAKVAPEDPYCGLADPSTLCTDIQDLDLFDVYEPGPEELYERARVAEEAARAVEGVTNSEGGGAGWGRVTIALATSDGFAGGYQSSSHGVHASVLAGEGTGMERDYDHSSEHHLEDLEDAAAIGASAGARAVARLNPRKVQSQQVPIVFDPRVSRGLVGHLLGAINGSSVARGTSFLREKMGEQIMRAGINIIDDPHRVRGQSSKPFDGEGAVNRETLLIDDGVLQTWLLDSATAKQLDLKSTGHAARGIGGPPAPSATNVHMAAGDLSPEELMSDIEKGLYITEMIGFGVNQVTGDYSRGASGFWIENGQKMFPVSELTIAGNMKDMFMQITPANDLEFRYGTNAPTIRIDQMMVAGT